MRRLILAVLVMALCAPAQANVLVGRAHSYGPRTASLTCGGNQVTYYVRDADNTAWAGVQFKYELFEEYTAFEVWGPNYYFYAWGPPVSGGYVFSLGENLDPGIYYGRLWVYSYTGEPPCSCMTRFVVK